MRLYWINMLAVRFVCAGRLFLKMAFHVREQPLSRSRHYRLAPRHRRRVRCFTLNWRFQTANCLPKGTENPKRVQLCRNSVSWELPYIVRRVFYVFVNYAFKETWVLHLWITYYVFAVSWKLAAAASPKYVDRVQEGGDGRYRFCPHVVFRSRAFRRCCLCCLVGRITWWRDGCFWSTVARGYKRDGVIGQCRSQRVCGVGYSGVCIAGDRDW